MSLFIRGQRLFFSKRASPIERVKFRQPSRETQQKTWLQRKASLIDGDRYVLVENGECQRCSDFPQRYSMTLSMSPVSSI